MKHSERLPSLEGKSKTEILDLLLREEYGYFPDVDISVEVSVESAEQNFAAGRFYRECGGLGFVSEDKLPVTDNRYNDGEIGYHLRRGTHYMSREDWQRYFEFLNFGGQ